MSVQDQVRQLVERHLASLPERLASIGNALSDVVNDRIDRDAALAELIELAHSLNGASGSIGFLEISRAAAALEAHLNDLAARVKTS